MGNHTQPCPIKHLSPAHSSSTTGILMTDPLYYEPPSFPHQTTHRLNISSVPAEHVALIRSQVLTVAGKYFLAQRWPPPQTRNPELVWGIDVSGHNICQHKSHRRIMSHQGARRKSLCRALLNSKLTDSLPAVTVQCIRCDVLTTSHCLIFSFRNEGTSSHICLWASRPHWATQGQRCPSIFTGVWGRTIAKLIQLVQLE